MSIGASEVGAVSEVAIAYDRVKPSFSLINQLQNR
jgi:hypothetical protein